MIRMGLAVPPGFALSIEMYREKKLAFSTCRFLSFSEGILNKNIKL